MTTNNQPLEDAQLDRILRDIRDTSPRCADCGNPADLFAGGYQCPACWRTDWVGGPDRIVTWGRPLPPVGEVPEPGTLLPFGLGLAALLRRAARRPGRDGVGR